MGEAAIDTLSLPQQRASVEAELRADIATAQVVRFDFRHPIDDVLRSDGAHWLDLCLTPRPADACACYTDHWAPHRFERIGNLFIAPAGETLHAKSAIGGRDLEGGAQTSLICKLDPAAITRWFGEDVQWTERRLEAGLDIADESIRGLLMRMVREVTRPGFAAETLLDLVAAQVAIELGRYCTAMRQDHVKGGLAAWRLRLIDERVREVGKAATLIELATLCNLSPRQLSRAFRTSRGCSIGHYIEKHRLESAKRLLQTRQPVKSVADALGFSSPSAFSYAFRRMTGVSPFEYQQRA